MSNFTVSDMISYGHFYAGLKHLESSCKSLYHAAAELDQYQSYNSTISFSQKFGYVTTIYFYLSNADNENPQAHKYFSDLATHDNQFVQAVNSTLVEYKDYYNNYYLNAANHGLSAIASKCNFVVETGNINVNRYLGKEEPQANLIIARADHPDLQPQEIIPYTISEISNSDIYSIKTLQPFIENVAVICHQMDYSESLLTDYLDNFHNLSVKAQKQQFQFINGAADEVIAFAPYGYNYFSEFAASNSTFTDKAYPILKPLYTNLYHFIWIEDTSFQNLNSTCWKIVELGQQLINSYIGE